MKAKKSLGQNFLMEFSTSQKMVDSLSLKKDDLVVEIGPGLGALTKLLVEKATQVCASINAIEIDPRFIENIESIFGKSENFNLINADILKWLPEFYPARDFKVLGSIPYYITSPILHEVVRQGGRVEICVLMVQKEVAKKVVNLCPDASYLSTFVNTFFNTEVLEEVPREFFKPIPNVDSAILKLLRRNNVEIDKNQISRYEKFLHHAFSKPRKMLNKTFDREFLEHLEIDPKNRPQHIPLEKWIEAFNYKQELKD